MKVAVTLMQHCAQMSQPHTMSANADLMTEQMAKVKYPIFFSISRMCHPNDFQLNSPQHKKRKILVVVFAFVIVGVAFICFIVIFVTFVSVVIFVALAVTSFSNADCGLCCCCCCGFSIFCPASSGQSLVPVAVGHHNIFSCALALDQC